ncbi:hypothetical protein BD309DRAFT_963768 [Dichomitus squalens]|uniref:Uncharacterized protein n=1 Tax=Dichomitus squalens TaxID=114155 RepID=A0A4Q9N0J4_9APHY|nr:hypothetical protein BD311DRAFT_751421 [Dichomitus squalens]TBU42139.1 hypothetical protein BD309DRAFT_963768 [Dichomitus squalens]TBU61358.1 hypothetical protein BD310DRAFT_921286 [Dichomitus squalens]
MSVFQAHPVKLRGLTSTILISTIIAMTVVSTLLTASHGSGCTSTSYPRLTLRPPAAHVCMYLHFTPEISTNLQFHIAQAPRQDRFVVFPCALRC